MCGTINTLWPGIDDGVVEHGLELYPMFSRVL